MGVARDQRRGKRIAMSPLEVSAFFAEQRTCRVATVGIDGPHVSPMWFAWDGLHLWLYSLVSSQRWTDLVRDPRISVVVDAGESSFEELRGVEVRGVAEIVGDVPRVGGRDDRLELAERAFARDTGRDAMVYDGRHAWLRIKPTKIVSWDHRKRLADPAAEANQGL